MAGVEFELGSKGKADLERIMEKLNIGKQFLRSPRAMKIKWRMDIFNQYKEIVTAAMGSIRAYGGRMEMRYEGLEGGAYWKNLAPATLAKKAMHVGSNSGFMGPIDPYAQYRGDFSIWVDTGATKERGVKVSEDLDFVGIQRGQYLERAYRTEHGDGKYGTGILHGGPNVPPRPLFAVANFLFITAISKALQNPESELAKHLKADIVDLVFVRAAGWGRANDLITSPQQDQPAPPWARFQEILRGGR